jgi:hypothetical protein
MKLSGYESQQPIIQFLLSMTDPSVNARAAALDRKPQHRAVGLDLYKALPQQSVDRSDARISVMQRA